MAYTLADEADEHDETWRDDESLMGDLDEPGSSVWLLPPISVTTQVPDSDLRFETVHLPLSHAMS